MSREEAIKELTEQDRLCTYCRYSSNCDGGVKNYGDGPIFPPCADGDLNDLINIEEYIEEVEG